MRVYGEVVCMRVFAVELVLILLARTRPTFAKGLYTRKLYFSKVRIMLQQNDFNSSLITR